MMKSRTVVAAAAILALVLAGCSKSSTPKAQSQNDISGTTFPAPSTTLAIADRLLATGDLPGTWADAGGLDYQTVTSDQPQRCFNAMDTLDQGDIDNSSAGFKYQGGLPILSEVIFTFQPGASKPAVDGVAKQLDSCGAFDLGGGVQGEVVPATVNVKGLDDAHSYVVRYQDSSTADTTTVLIGKSGDSVLLVLYKTGAAVPKRADAQTLFQLAVNKFTSGSVDKGKNQTA